MSYLGRLKTAKRKRVGLSVRLQPYSGTLMAEVANWLNSVERDETKKMVEAALIMAYLFHARANSGLILRKSNVVVGKLRIYWISMALICDRLYKCLNHSGTIGNLIRLWMPNRPLRQRCLPSLLSKA